MEDLRRTAFLSPVVNRGKRNEQRFLIYLLVGYSLLPSQCKIILGFLLGKHQVGFVVKLLENHSNDIQIASNEKARVLFLERTVLKTVKFGGGKGFGLGRQRQHFGGSGCCR